MTRPEDAAARAELERQAKEMGLLNVDRSFRGEPYIWMIGHLDLRALVDAVLAAHRSGFAKTMTAQPATIEVVSWTCPCVLEDPPSTA